MKEKVSIIIPFYNAKKYLRSCITQLQKQSYSNIELLLLDDGSTDGGREEIEDLINDDNILYYRLPHQGVSVARNKGIEKAQGKYISFVDVDDSPKVDFIKTLVHDIEKQHCDVVICNYYRFDDNGNVLNVNDMPWKNQVIHRHEIEDVLIPNMLSADDGHNITGVAWRILVSKEFITTNKLKFQPGVSIAEDFLFTVQLYHRCRSIYVESQFLYGYRQSIDSTVHKYRTNALANDLQLQSILKRILISERIYKKNKKRYEKQYLRIYTRSVSNAARNKKFRDTFFEIREICNNFRHCHVIVNKEQNWNITLRISFWLLRHRCAFTLSVLYRIKEYIRLLSLK